MSVDLVCISHLRWNFVFQRPQHLMSRFRQYYRVFYVEEPLYDTESPNNEIVQDPQSDVWVVTPHIPALAEDTMAEKKALLDLLFEEMQIRKMILWYYTPLAMGFTDHLQPELVVYDCMDELSAFKFADPALKEMEQRLVTRADIMFTGGVNLYEAKKHLHHNIHAFPSSIDKKHFGLARTETTEPADQASIPHPRIGFYGVIDERFDMELLTTLATMHPHWHFVLIGPVTKIDAGQLPKLPNIHFMGKKSYRELPSYLAGWDVAMMPFLLNEATEFISPTKTPEYLAGGKPVVSTPVKDVVRPYGELQLVEIAATPTEFSDAIQRLLSNKDKAGWLAKVDAFLANTSWNKTWMGMAMKMNAEMERKRSSENNKNQEAYV